MAIEVNGYTIQPGADLSGADLSGADLSNMDLSKIEFDGANLTNANLSGSNLHYSSLDENTNLSGADLSNVSFYGDGTANGISGVSYANFNGGKFSNVADLSGTDFTNLFLLNTNFSGLDLTGISFKSATLDRADFSNSNLSGADFGDTKASATTFTGAILDGANFYNAVHETYMPSYESIVSGRVLDDAVGSYVMDEDFSVANSGSVSTLSTSREVNGYTIQPGADLSGADLSGADLSNMDLSKIEFDGANLTNANLSGSNLHYSSLDENTNLSGADLSNVSFYGDGTANGISGVSYANFNGGKFSNVADLSGTDFTNLFLLNTNFSGLDLTGISFKSATLDRADFSNSNLSGADFGDTKASATTFTGAILDGANFYNAVHETYMPSYESIVSGRVLDDAVGSYVMDEDFSVSKVPIPTIDLNDADGIVDAVEVKSWVGVTGTAFPGSQVELISTLTETGGNMSFYVDVDADGKWSMPYYEGNNFPDGTYALSFRTLHDGNQSDEVKTTLELSQIKHTPFKITADGGKYYIDGVLTPELELVSGHTYQFDLSDSSLNTHPLRFNMDGSPWSDGVEVTGTLGQDQMVVISIPSASKGVLSYYCTNHSGMGNDCDIIGNTIAGTDEIDVIYGLAGDDVISAGFGADMIYADAGDDTIVLSASDTYHSFYKAANRSSDLQTGTEERVSLKGMLKVEHSADGGFGTDTIKLDEGNIAYFLHDSYSDFYWQQSFATDTLGNTSAPRFFGIEKITGSDGNNIIDLTSPDYSLAEQSIEVDGGLGADIIWGSDANETIKGGDGDDELFGGAGTNVLTGGAGADEFQFTMTSENDSVTDFNAAEGDTLKFFNTGGATFDRDSVTANSEGDGISIEYSHNDQVQSLNISLGLSSSSVTNDLLSAIEII